jgi:hypothetical protein
MKYCELFLLLCLVSMSSWSGESAISNTALGLYDAKKGVNRPETVQFSVPWHSKL